MRETFKDISGYKGDYQVSNLGRIKSLKFTEKILRQKNDGHGYLVVNLYNKGSKSKKVHRLVAIAFIPNPENKKTVNHKKGIKTDNRAKELEWATYSENHLHSFRGVF